MNRTTAPAFLGLLLVASPLLAQPSLESVTVEARVAADGSTTVTMSYFLRPEGAETIELMAIRFGGSRVANVRAFVGHREVSFHVDGTGAEWVGARIELGAPVSERLPLRLRYEVIPRPDLARDPIDIAVPMLVARWPPSASDPEAFRATVFLPDGIEARATFPSEFEAVESIDLTSDSNAYRVSLPVVPSLLRFTAGHGPEPFFSAGRGFDLAATAVLLALSVIGWRRLREAMG